jgi:hypothetical protein
MWKPSIIRKLACSVGLVLYPSFLTFAQTGSGNEPVRYVGGVYRYGSSTDWKESNTSYPFYTSSKEEGFVAACNALLANKLMISQWRDEDRGPDDFQPLKGNCRRQRNSSGERSVADLQCQQGVCKTGRCRAVGD